MFIFVFTIFVVVIMLTNTSTGTIRFTVIAAKCIAYNRAKLDICRY